MRRVKVVVVAPPSNVLNPVTVKAPAVAKLPLDAVVVAKPLIAKLPLAEIAPVALIVAPEPVPAV